MDHLTLVLELDDDGSVRLSSNTLGGTPYAIMRGGQAERVARVHCILEADIEQYLRNFHAADLSGAWHGLDDARDVVCEAARHAIDVAGGLVGRLHVPVASRFERRDLAALLADTDDAGAQLDAAEEAAQRVLEAIRGLRTVHTQASQTAAAGRSPAAHDGRHQQPLLPSYAQQDA